MSQKEPFQSTIDTLRRVREQINDMLTEQIDELTPGSLTHFLKNYEPYPRDEVMRQAGKTVNAYVAGGEFPANNHLENAVWAKQLRGTVTRNEFRTVCNNLRRGWSAVGDC